MDVEAAEQPVVGEIWRVRLDGKGCAIGNRGGARVARDGDRALLGSLFVFFDLAGDRGCWVVEKKAMAAGDVSELRV